MIHHFSMAANEPLHVAHALAELLHGTVAPFSKHPDGYVVFTGDASGTLIEICPRGLELRPGLAHESFCYSTNPSHSFGYSITHFNLSIPASEAEIQMIVGREGWRCVRVSAGGFFEVIELWVENHTLLELMPPTLMPQYLAFLKSDQLKLMLKDMALSA